VNTEIDGTVEGSEGEISGREEREDGEDGEVIFWVEGGGEEGEKGEEEEGEDADHPTIIIRSRKEGGEALPGFNFFFLYPEQYQKNCSILKFRGLVKVLYLICFLVYQWLHLW
jgi:hypothetical protein